MVNIRIEQSNNCNNLHVKNDDSGFNSKDGVLTTTKKKKTKAQKYYRNANAAVIPSYIPPEARLSSDLPVCETQVWTSRSQLRKYQILQFLCEAKNFKFNIDQALAILHCNHYALDRARSDLHIFEPLFSSWPEDRSTFIQALSDKGKYFYGIKKKFFPDRLVKDMVEYYYTWKMEKKRRKCRAEQRKVQFIKIQKACPGRSVSEFITSSTVTKD